MVPLFVERDASHGFTAVQGVVQEAQLSPRDRAMRRVN